MGVVCDRDDELADGTHVGELCFKGLTDEGSAEIGYGVAEEYQGRGYAAEAVAALADWALDRTGVRCVTAETEEGNIASQKVLAKAGFVPTGEIGEEGPLFIRKKAAKGITIRPEEHKDYKDIVSLILRSFREGTDCSDGTDIVALVEEIRQPERPYPAQLQVACFFKNAYGGLCKQVEQHGNLNLRCRSMQINVEIVKDKP